MSLDKNLFTLLFAPNNNSTSDPAGTVVDLIDPSGIVHYRKRRIPGQVYRAELYDPISEALLASATAPSPTSKHKTLELYNPSKVVELKFTGTLSFRWSFRWEEHEFEWRREECFIIRKPDPPVLVAVTKEPPGRIKTASVQVLDYNLNRFDIEDRKGLEITILFALSTFQDASDAYHEPNSPPNTTAMSSPSSTASPPVLRALTDISPWKSSGSGSGNASVPPPPPPKPAPKKGVERIAELQQGRGEVNEVSVVEEGAITDYAMYCCRLVQDEAMLFISIRSADASQVPKVIQVVEETKRIRHKAGEPDLHQYVLYDTEKPKPKPAGQKGPRIINLDDEGAGAKSKGNGKGYSPPSSLVVHLSKIDMPELRPRGASIGRSNNEAGPGLREESKKERKERERAEKGRREQDKGKEKGKDKGKDRDSHAKVVPRASAGPATTASRQGSSKLQRARSTDYLHTYAHQVHPHQPSPSPSQLNNPGIYVTPPPPPPSGRGGGGYRQSMYGSLNGSGYEGVQSGSTGLFGRLLGGR
ncbi:hypothetical protein F5I97DRAFT_1158855 [Phlebopus sp. FC_14]|nr:hypothetical protein F5I97DRAFT_1158855 [Phlebopus sp. FC_14]